VAKVSETREWLCELLSKYCKRPSVEEDPLRFGRLLMCMAPMRTWSLKSMESLVFVRIANSLDSILVDAFMKKSETV
jgi:hypothetical protein